MDVFREGKSVCAGYADAYSVLLSVAGIENYKTGNFEHEFVAAQIDGSYCYIDCTWDDTNLDENGRHTYFGMNNRMKWYTYGAEYGMFLTDNMKVNYNDTYKNHYWYRTGYTSRAIDEAKAVIQSKLQNKENEFDIKDLDFNGKYGLYLLCAILSDQNWSMQGVEKSLVCFPLDESTIRCIFRTESVSENTDFIVDYVEDGVEILSYTGNSESVAIPEIIDGLPVRVIGNSAFTGRYLLKEVMLPNTLRKIEGNAFKNNASLISINFPEQLEEIGGYSFMYCRNLKINCEFPETLRTIGACAFEYSGVLSARIPDSVNIGDTAFMECPNLVSVVFYDSGIEGGSYIGSSAFAGCRQLSEMVLPDDLWGLGGTVFTGTAIRRLSIPNGLSFCGMGAISGCDNLKEVIIDPDNRCYTMEGEFFCNKDKTFLISAIANETGVYNIPSSITSIGPYAFAEMKSVSEVTVPSGVSRIPIYCFAWCENLKKLIIENCNATFDEYALDSCWELEIIQNKHDCHNGTCIYCGEVVNAKIDIVVEKTAVEAKVTAYISDSNLDIISMGVLIGNKDQDLTLDTNGRSRIVFSEMKDNRFSLTYANNENVSYRAYMIVRNTFGQEKVYYSEIV